MPLSLARELQHLHALTERHRIFESTLGLLPTHASAYYMTAHLGEVMLIGRFTSAQLHQVALALTAAEAIPLPTEPGHGPV
jgi:hypothetical protein